MNTELQQLKDIHLPQAISMWPIAPGWISSLVILVLALFFTIYFYYNSRQKKYMVKFALGKLEKLMKDDSDNINIAAEISTLLRRTALHYFPRENIAGLSGQDWIDFLNRNATVSLTKETQYLLLDLPYQKKNTADLTSLIVFAKNWLTNLSKKRELKEK